MDLQLQGKRALVTGSSAGIGKAIAKVLASEGVVVCVTGRNEERASQVAEEIRQAGGTAKVTIGDLATDEGADRVAQQALEQLGGVDILVNNAGEYPWGGWFNSTSQDWLDLYNNDVVSTVRLIQRIVPQMVRRRWGRVIQVASAAGIFPPANNAPIYAVAKAAQLHLTKSLAIELTGTGVTANAVAPGPVDARNTINMFAQIAKEAGCSTDDETVKKYFVDTVMNDPPVPDWSNVTEVASLAAYLSSPLSRTITGAIYTIDSGFAISGFKRVQSTLQQE